MKKTYTPPCIHAIVQITGKAAAKKRKSEDDEPLYMKKFIMHDVTILDNVCGYPDGQSRRRERRKEQRQHKNGK